MIRYARAPSAALRALLAPGGLLAPLLVPRTVRGLPLDIHFRERDHLHVYCGLTRLVDARLVRGEVRVTTDRAYTTQACAKDFFSQAWTTGDAGFAGALDRYLSGVAVHPRHLAGEGAVQAAWAAVLEPWYPLDREVVIGHADAGEASAARTFPAVAAATRELESLRRADGWPALERLGGELDRLGVDADGRLVLLELKGADPKADASIAYAPLQLLQYVHEWAAAYPLVRADLEALREARIACGLSPPTLPTLSAGLRPAIGFGTDAQYQGAGALPRCARPRESAPAAGRPAHRGMGDRGGTARPRADAYGLPLALGPRSSYRCESTRTRAAGRAPVGGA
jgi:hypothetical protein